MDHGVFVTLFFFLMIFCAFPLVQLTVAGVSCFSCCLMIDLLVWLSIRSCSLSLCSRHPSLLAGYRFLINCHESHRPRGGGHCWVAAFFLLLQHPNQLAFYRDVNCHVMSSSRNCPPRQKQLRCAAPLIETSLHGSWMTASQLFYQLLIVSSSRSSGCGTR